MEPRAHYVLIGLFTVVSVVGALLFALWMGRADADSNQNYYEITFNQAVSGLAVGNTVQYNGIKVGNVSDLSLDPDNPSKVRTIIRVASNTPVTTDTQARLTLANITGSMNIQLQGGTSDSPRLPGTQQEPGHIPAARSPLSSLMDNSESMIAASNRLLSQANQLLSDENVARVSEILINVDRLTKSLAVQSENVEPLISGLGTLTTQAERAMDSINAAGASARELLDNSGQQAMDSASQAMQSLAEVSQDLLQIGTEHSGDIDSALRGLGGIDPAMQELRNTLSSFSLLLRRLNENPTQTLLGGDSPEEFRP
ncbi:MlaD family protein [Halomonas halocynthiae]|uniref:MlaD family protein n=1 Tax=Halomonas halocynthiae TaxID=176290 RepID=UPI00040F24F1|nr:MlaD family protein [Halomonas halocynthiae]